MKKKKAPKTPKKKSGVKKKGDEFMDSEIEEDVEEDLGDEVDEIGIKNDDDEIEDKPY